MIFNEAICSAEAAQKFLDTYFGNDPIYNGKLIDIEKYRNDTIPSLFPKVRQSIECLYDKLMIHKEDDCFNKKLQLSLECVICEKLHDSIISTIYAKYHIEDAHLFKKIMILDEKNVTVKQLGGSEEYVTRIHAAIVELSNLDACKTPIEKINCIMTTIDMIYAQVKLELAEIDDEFDNCVPVVENEDALYILMAVIIKSKPKHMYSNIVFMDELSVSLKQNKLYKDSINVLCTAIERLDAIEIGSVSPSSDGSIVEKEMSYLKAIELMYDDNSDVHEDAESNNKPLLNYHLRRTKRLIHTSVNI